MRINVTPFKNLTIPFIIILLFLISINGCRKSGKIMLPNINNIHSVKHNKKNRVHFEKLFRAAFPRLITCCSFDKKSKIKVSSRYFNRIRKQSELIPIERKRVGICNYYSPYGGQLQYENFGFTNLRTSFIHGLIKISGLTEKEHLKDITSDYFRLPLLYKAKDMKLFIQAAQKFSVKKIVTQTIKTNSTRRIWNVAEKPIDNTLHIYES